ncbi:hypothetical protein [Streptomyces sp. I05A-00742]|uniref:hypothetical protein n=1 Tax=Streptomyces sp. I05A-00742 TaxID=2732853 RepID=UPI0014898592|nr:hypothetical protein [Streptomyces sp. I05A-00742]
MIIIVPPGGDPTLRLTAVPDGATVVDIGRRFVAGLIRQATRGTLRTRSRAPGDRLMATAGARALSDASRPPLHRLRGLGALLGALYEPGHGVRLRLDDLELTDGGTEYGADVLRAAAAPAPYDEALAAACADVPPDTPVRLVVERDQQLPAAVAVARALGPRVPSLEVTGRWATAHWPVLGRLGPFADARLVPAPRGLAWELSDPFGPAPGDGLRWRERAADPVPSEPWAGRIGLRELMDPEGPCAGPPPPRNSPGSGERSSVCAGDGRGFRRAGVPTGDSSKCSPDTRRPRRRPASPDDIRFAGPTTVTAPPPVRDTAGPQAAGAPATAARPAAGAPGRGERWGSGAFPRLVVLGVCAAPDRAVGRGGTELPWDQLASCVRVLRAKGVAVVAELWLGAPGVAPEGAEEALARLEDAVDRVIGLRVFDWPADWSVPHWASRPVTLADTGADLPRQRAVLDPAPLPPDRLAALVTALGRPLARAGRLAPGRVAGAYLLPPGPAPDSVRGLDPDVVVGRRSARADKALAVNLRTGACSYVSLRIADAIDRYRDGYALREALRPLSPGAVRALRDGGVLGEVP